MGYVVGHLSCFIYFNERNTQENLKPWSVETLEESFSSRSGKKDLRKEISGKEEDNRKLPQKRNRKRSHFGL
jgi:hypothetical protein